MLSGCSCFLLAVPAVGEPPSRAAAALSRGRGWRDAGDSRFEDRHASSFAVVRSVSVELFCWAAGIRQRLRAASFAVVRSVAVELFCWVAGIRQRLRAASTIHARILNGITRTVSRLAKTWLDSEKIQSSPYESKDPGE